MKRLRYAVSLAFCAFWPGFFSSAGYAQTQATQPATSSSAANPSSMTGAAANFAPNDPAGEWRSAGRDYANTRYSPLDQINAQNVKQLKIAWTFSDGIPFGHEAPPLVIGGTMYIVTPFPNVLYALDLTQPGAPIKWTYQPNPAPLAIGKACCDSVNRGVAYAGGKLVYNLLDDHTVAVDAATGKELWRTKLEDAATGTTMTMAPLIVGKRVYVGNSGGEMGSHGWLAALDLDTGKEQWRAFSTGPDDQVRIGADFKPFYSWMKGKDLGVSSWPADMWRHGGGTVWGWISYDPDLNLIYYGTSNPGPRVPAQRPGNNFWTASVFARDPETGMAKWAYQFTPHDQWDYDGVNEMILLDLPIGGQTRKTLVTFNRNGFAYTIDRVTGEVLVAQPFGAVNWASSIDLKTGLPNLNSDKNVTPEVEVQNICPTHIGSKDWEPAAFSPRTGLLYADIFNICMNLTDHEVSYIPGTPYDGMEIKTHAATKKKWGEFMAWDPVKGKKVWSIDEQYMTMSGVLATAGDVVFYGTADGWLRAVNARDGAVLWSQKLGSGIISQPATYLGPDGRQYLAVYTGVGGVVSQVMGRMKGFPPRGSALYVFSIDGVSNSSGSTQLTTQSPGASAAFFGTPD
jgi:PQQ-dependent dehydrogenase (methanol/ethanol family)